MYEEEIHFGKLHTNACCLWWHSCYYMC